MSFMSLKEAMEERKRKQLEAERAKVMQPKSNIFLDSLRKPVNTMEQSINSGRTITQPIKQAPVKSNIFLESLHKPVVADNGVKRNVFLDNIGSIKPTVTIPAVKSNITTQVKPNIVTPKPYSQVGDGTSFMSGSNLPKITNEQKQKTIKELEEKIRKNNDESNRIYREQNKTNMFGGANDKAKELGKQNEDLESQLKILKGSEFDRKFKNLIKAGIRSAGETVGNLGELIKTNLPYMLDSKRKKEEQTKKLDEKYKNVDMSVLKNKLAYSLEKKGIDMLNNDSIGIGQVVKDFGGDFAQPLEQVANKSMVYDKSREEAREETPGVSNVIENAGAMIPSMVVGAVTGNPQLGMATFWGGAKASYNKQYIAEGYDINKADKASTFMSLVEVGSEYLGDLAGGITPFKKGAIADFFKKGFGGTLKSLNIEGLSEVGNELVNMAVDKYYLDKDISPEEGKDRIWQSYYGGVFLGIFFKVLGIPGSVASKVINSKSEIDSNDIENIFKDEMKRTGKSLEQIIKDTPNDIGKLTSEISKNAVDKYENQGGIGNEGTGTNLQSSGGQSILGNEENGSQANITSEIDIQIKRVQQSVLNDLNSLAPKIPLTTRDIQIGVAKNDRETNISNFYKENVGADIFFYDGIKLPTEFVSAEMPNAVFVRRQDMTKDGTNDMQWGAGHGVIHTIKTQKPQMYDRLKTVYTKIGISTEQRTKYLDLFKDNVDYQERLANDDSLLVEEMIADEGANLFVNRSFLEKVYTTSTTMFNEVMAIAQKIYGGITGKEYSTYADKLQKQRFKTEFAKVLTEIKADIEAGKLKGGKEQYVETPVVAPGEVLGAKDSKVTPKYSILGMSANLDKIKGLQSKNIFTGEDGKQRIEMSDSKASVRTLQLKTISKNEKQYTTLESVLKHKSLFNAYPKLKRVKVKVYQESIENVNGNKEGRGWYSSTKNTIGINKKILNDNTQLKKTILHEVQHAIQWIEGFSHGTSWRKFKQEMLDMGFNDSEVIDQVAYDKYYKAYGEREARYVADSSNLSQKEINKGSIKYSMRKDSKGNELSKEQQEFFKDSKVVDEKGNLEVVYHGTDKNNKFTQFDINKAGKINVLGDGFYFSNNKEMADFYGNNNTMEAYINIENPFIVENNSTPALIYAIRQENPYKDVNVSKSSGALDNKKVREYLKSRGYDGIKSGDDTYIAFESNQIKNIDNKKPTASDDIRYSNRDNKNKIEDKFKELTGDSILLAENKLAGIAVRNNMRYHGNNKTAYEDSPYSREALDLIKDYHKANENVFNSEGNILSKEQRNYFKNSIVRNDKDNLQIVYHGSPSNFNKFTYDFIGTNGVSEGTGFYFTDNKEIATGYSKKLGEGRLFETYLNIEKPLSNTEKTITKVQLAKFIRALDPTGNDYLSNYEDVNSIGYEKIVQKAVDIEYDSNDTDAGMIQSIMNTEHGNYEKRYKKLKETLGFDGIIIENAQWGEQVIYIPFLPEQVKDINNTAPTKNKDIRYSNRDKSEVISDKSSTGEVIKVGDYVYKNTAFKNGTATIEKEVYTAMKGNANILEADIVKYEGKEKIRTPYSKNIISIDTIAKDKRYGLGTTLDSHVPNVIKAIMDLSNAGYDYNDPLQFAYTDNGVKLFDFSNAQKTTVEEAMENNYQTLSRFLHEFGLGGAGRRISNGMQLKSVLNSALEDKDMKNADNLWFVPDGIQDIVSELFTNARKQGIEKVNNVYYTRNSRGISIGNLVTSDIMQDKDKFIFTEKPISIKDQTEWEIKPLYEQAEVKEKAMVAKQEPKKAWSDRGLTLNDLAEMTAKEVDKNAIRDNIWIEPDYKKMIDDGRDVDLVYYIKLIRDSISEKPVSYKTDTTSKEEKIARYVDAINDIKKEVDNIKTLEEAKDVLEKTYIDNGYIELDKGKLVLTDKGKLNPIVNADTLKIMKSLKDISKLSKDQKQEEIEKSIFSEKTISNIKEKVKVVEKQAPVTENKAVEKDISTNTYPENSTETGFQLKKDLNKKTAKTNIEKMTKAELDKLSREELVQKLLEAQKPKKEVVAKKPIAVKKVKEAVITKDIKQGIYEVLGTNKNTYEKKQIADIVAKYIDRNNTLESNLNNINSLGKELLKYLEDKRIVNFIDEDLEAVKKDLKGMNIKVSDMVKKDITDYNDFRKSLFGKVNLSITEGLPLDVAYQELQGKYPHMFKEDSVLGDQLQNIADVFNMNSKYYMSADELLKNYIVPVVNNVGEQLTNEYGDLPAIYQGGQLPSAISNKLKVPSNRELIKQKVAEVINYIKPLVAKTGKVANVLTEMPKLEKKTVFKKVIDTAYQATFDSLNSIALMGKEMKIPVLYGIANNTRQAFSTANYIIDQEFVDMYYKPLGKSLRKTFEIEPERKADFFTYLFHRHNIYRYPKGKPVFGNSVTDQDSKIVVAGYEKTNPDFVTKAEDVYAYTRNLLKLRVQNGTISKETAEYYTKTYPHYVPTFRDIESMTGAYSQSRTIKVASPGKKAKGGNQDLLPIDVMLARQTMQAVASGRMNVLGMAIAKTVRLNPKAMSKYAVEVKDNKFKKDYVVDMKNALTYGNQDTVMEILEDNLSKRTKTMGNILKVYDNGDLITLQVSNELYDSLLSLTSDELSRKIAELPIIKQLIVNPTRAVKNTITTYNPLFIPVNAIRDIQDALLYSQDTKGFIRRYPDAFKEIMTNGEYWKMYQASGAFQSSFFDTEKGYKTLTKKEKIIRDLQRANEIVEQLPRLTEFMNIIKKGDGSYGNVVMATLAGSDLTVNFGRSGIIGRIVDKLGGMYFNASLQGADKFSRTLVNAFGSKDAKKIMGLIIKFTIVGMAPAIINHILLGDDDDYEELENRDRDNNFLIPKGDGTFWKIPKGRALSVVGALPVRLIRMLNGEEKPFEDYMNTAIQQVAPVNPLENNIYSPAMAVTQKDPKDWKKQSIIPKALQDEFAEDQWDESSTSLAKGIGKALKISPKKIDYVMKQYSGGIGQIAMPMMTKRAEVNPLLAKFTVDSKYSSKVTSDFYDAMDEATKLKRREQTARKLPEGFVTAKSLMSSYLNKESAKISILYKEKKEIEASDLSNKDKRIKARIIQIQIVDMQREALANYKSGTPTYELKYLRSYGSSPTIIDLFNELGTDRVLPTDDINKTFTYKNVKFELTDSERDNYAKEANAILEKLYSKIDSSNSFRSLSAEKKKEMLLDLKTKALKNLKTKYKGKAVVRTIKGV